MYSIGQIRVEDGSYRPVEGEWDGKYHSFVFRDNYLVGAILLGDTTLSAAVKRAIEKRVDCSALLRAQPRAEQILDFLKAPA